MAPQSFTPQSADRAARRLEPLARRVCAGYRHLREAAPDPVVEGPVPGDYFRALRRFHGDALRLAAEGVRFRDLSRGWFEFPCREGGRAKRLQWRLGGVWDEPGEVP